MYRWLSACLLVIICVSSSYETCSALVLTDGSWWKPVQDQLHRTTGHSSNMASINKAQVEDPPSQQLRREFLIGGATAFSLLIWSPTLALADDGDDTKTTVHKVDYPIAGKCGQAEVPEKVVSLVKASGGFKDGSCGREGFVNADGVARGTGDKDKERTYSIYSQ